MNQLNHFAISAGMGSTLGPRVRVHHGQLGSSELAATVSRLLQRRDKYIDDLSVGDDVTRKYEKAVTRAFLMVRRGFSSDRVLADPSINRQFIKVCRDLGVDDEPFRLNMTLVGLRKHNKLKAKSKRSIVHDQWRYAVASEVAARVLYYRHGASVDTVLAHPGLVAVFDRLASLLAPGYSSFEYRWAALHMRKKGANVKVQDREIDRLQWSGPLRFAAKDLPSDEGVYTLFENRTCLLVGATEDIQESISGQRRIAEVPLFDDDLWKPDPAQLSWQYLQLPDWTSDRRFGVVRSLVGRWRPVFNIPRGAARLAA